MKILIIGNNELSLELRNQGHTLITDPSEHADAVICQATTCRIAPDNIPMFVLLTGGLSDWTAQKEFPDAHFYYDAQELINELNAKVYEADTSSLPINRQESLIVTSYANKGGVGKTTTAISIATLVAEQGAKTVLVDTDYGSANLASFYNISKKFNNYLTNPELISSSLFKVQGNLYLLPAPIGILPNQIQANDIFKTLKTLQGMFQVVVCDTPTAPWDKKYVHPVFANADLVYAVVNQSKFSVEEVKIYGPQLMAMGTDIERMRIILNGYNPKLISIQKVEEAFNQTFKKEIRNLPKINTVIPHNYEEHVNALQKGVVLNQDIWRKVTTEILEKLSGELKTEETKESFLQKMKRWWSK